MDAFIQVLGVLARLSTAERASIDECYLDISEEAKKRMAACSGHPPLPVNLEQVHVCGEVRLKFLPYALRSLRSLIVAVWCGLASLRINRSDIFG